MDPLFGAPYQPYSQLLNDKIISQHWSFPKMSHKYKALNISKNDLHVLLTTLYATVVHVVQLVTYVLEENVQSCYIYIQ